MEMKVSHHNLFAFVQGLYGCQITGGGRPVLMLMGKHRIHMGSLE